MADDVLRALNSSTQAVPDPAQATPVSAQCDPTDRDPCADVQARMDAAFIAGRPLLLRPLALPEYERQQRVLCALRALLDLPSAQAREGEEHC